MPFMFFMVDRLQAVFVEAPGGILERKPQCKLHKAWQVGCRAHHAKAIVRASLLGATTTRIGVAKLSAVERVEELRTELYSKPFLGAKLCILENRNVPVVDPLGPHIG